MYKNIAIANFIVAGVVLMGLLLRLPRSVWIQIDLAIAITCIVCGIKLIKK